MGIFSHELRCLGVLCICNCIQGRDDALHVITFTNTLGTRQLYYYLVSPSRHGLFPKLLGVGRAAWWPDGLGAKINAVRDWVMSPASAPDDFDLVLFIDAFDVLVFGGADEIRQKFEPVEKKTSRNLIFNCEVVCFQNFQISAMSFPSPRGFLSSQTPVPLLLLPPRLCSLRVASPCFAKIIQASPSPHASELCVLHVLLASPPQKNSKASASLYACLPYVLHVLPTPALQEIVRGA